MKKIISFVLLTLILITSNVFGKESLIGAGATFPYPLYSKMFDVFYKATGTKINYQAIGSGGGIRQLMAKTVDFGASDAFVSNKDLKNFDSPIVHIPICAGAVVLTYNLPNNPTIKLTPEIIADIFLGKIKKWNNQKITKINPDVKIPDIKISVIHRSDGSGTTFIFSDYLSKVNKKWKKTVGKGKSLNWPIGLGAKGNPGVAGLIKQIPGSIGYVELIYALSNKMPFAYIKNKSGNFIKPGIESVKLAANTKLPDDMRVSLINTESEFGYPISGFTWILIYKDTKKGNLNYEKSKTLIRLLKWMITKGQKYAKKLHYAPLSDKAIKKALKIINSIKYNNKSL